MDLEQKSNSKTTFKPMGYLSTLQLLIMYGKVA